MFLFGRRKKKREEERRAAEQAAAAEQARLAKEMKKAEEMRQAELAQKQEAARKAAEAAAEQAAEPEKAAEEPVAVAQKAEKPAKKAPAKKPAPKKAPEVVENEAPAEELGEEAAKLQGKFEIKRASDGRYMFNVRAGNTQVIASSQMYSSMTACKNGIASVGANAPVAAIEDQTLQTINEEKCPKFQIYFDKAGQYRFNLIAKNGNNILSCTQGYRQKASCKNGIKSVITNACAPTEILKAEK